VLIKKLVVGPIAANCYLIGCEATKEGMIVDPGDEAERVLEAVRELGLDIKFIVATHGHPDHIGAVSQVREGAGAEVCIHSDDASAISWRGGAADRLLREGDSLDFGDLHFVVFHTPGHTPGGICLSGAGVVFSGDTLFQGSVGRTDLPGSSYRQIIDSIQAKLMTLPDDTAVYPGHGPETTIGAQRQSNPYLHG